MAVADILADVVQGAAGAAGNTTAQNEVGAWQAQRQQQRGDQLKFALAPLSQSLNADQTRLALYADPNDPSKPLAGKEKEYQETLDRMTGTIGQMRGILGQKPSEPNPVEAGAGTLLDKLHITNHLKNHVAQVRAQDAAKYESQNQQMAGQYATGAPPNELSQYRQQLEAAGLSAPDVEEAVRRKAGLIQKTNYKNIVGPNGEKATIDLNNQQIPPGWTLAGVTSTAQGVKPIRSGQVTIGFSVNGKPYFKNDLDKPDTPPEVKEAFGALSQGEQDLITQKEKERQEQYAEIEKRQRTSLNAAMQRTIYQFQNSLASKQAGIADGLLGKQQQQYYAAQDLQQKMQSLLPEAMAGNQQAMVAILADHIAMTTHQPGASMRPTKALFDEAASSQPWLDKITKHFSDQGILDGVVLSPEQIQNMVDLAPIVTAAEKNTLDQMQQSMGATANPTPAQLQGPTAKKNKAARNGSSEKIRVKLSDGRTGTIDASDFDPATMTKVQ
jgi:hypothetical protein